MPPVHGDGGHRPAHSGNGSCLRHRRLRSLQYGDRRNEDEPAGSNLGQFVDEGLNFCLVLVGKLVRLKH